MPAKGAPVFVFSLPRGDLAARPLPPVNYATAYELKNYINTHFELKSKMFQKVQQNSKFMWLFRLLFKRYAVTLYCPTFKKQAATSLYYWT